VAQNGTAGKDVSLLRGANTPAYAATVRAAEERQTAERIPTDSAQSVTATQERLEANAKVADSRVLLEADKLDDAEIKLRDAIKADPENRAANYYLALAKEQRAAKSERGMERDSKKGTTEIAQALEAPGQIPAAAGVVPNSEADVAPIRKPSTDAPIPQAEIQTSENIIPPSRSTSAMGRSNRGGEFGEGQMPDPASVRSEEFINAFDYRDPEPVAGAPIAFAWERAHIRSRTPRLAAVLAQDGGVRGRPARQHRSAARQFGSMRNAGPRRIIARR
jgi:hypothetical protein